MTSLQTYLIISIVSMIISGAAVWRVTSSYKDTKWKNVIMERDVAANKVLTDAVEQVRQIEKQHALITTQLEIKNGQLKDEIDSMYTENRRLTRDLNGLRDPGTRVTSHCTVSPGTTTTSGSNDQTRGAPLSDEASEFLLTFANDSDKVALYAQTCYNWVSESDLH